MDDSPAAPGLMGGRSLTADRARARMLMALMGGRSLTATELAGAARVTRQTASSHLARLVDARLAAVEQAGRHRYFRLADHHVGSVIERLVGLADRLGGRRGGPGPAAPPPPNGPVWHGP